MNLLAPLGILYGRMMDLRNRLYDRGVIESHSLGARTVSIGNLTTGGTGKTPLVAQVAKILADSGEKVCILTRGYGRRNPRERVLVSDGKNILVEAAIGGDEPVELAHKLVGKAVVVADADRVAAAAAAKERFGITAFVLDDGFQHRRAKRDLDIVCIDATNPCGNGHILPAGTLRESFNNLGRADIIVITRTELVGTTADLEERLRRRNPDVEIFRSATRIVSVVPMTEFHAKAQSSQRGEQGEGWRRLRAEGDPNDPGEEVSLMAFCGLGNPDGFFGLLNLKFEEPSMDEFDMAMIKKFPDHHIYTQKDLDLLGQEARRCSIDAMITTAKDALKLSGLKFSVPCYVVEIEPVIDDAERFSSLLTSS